MMKPDSGAVFLPCSDIGATTRFYHGALGLEIAETQGDSVVIFDTGCGYWGFCRYADGRAPLSGPQGVCLSINLESEQAVADAYTRLKDRCAVHRPPARHATLPVYSFFLLDPDGYLVEFQKTGRG